MQKLHTTNELRHLTILRIQRKTEHSYMLGSKCRYYKLKLNHWKKKLKLHHHKYLPGDFARTPCTLSNQMYSIQ